MNLYDVDGNVLDVGSGLSLGFDSFQIPYLGIKEKAQETPVSVSIEKWSIPSQPNTWANSTWNANEFITNLYEPLLGSHNDGYSVTNKILGTDEGYNIYEFAFVPQNYKRTILLSAGMHALEITASFSLARLMYYVVNEPSASAVTQYLHDNVRIFLIPILDMGGFSASPRRFGTVNGVNQNGNFTWTDDNGGNAWDTFDTSAPYPEGWMYKGPEPFSEKQTCVLRDWLQSHQYQAEFWIDCHTGKGWDQDVWYYYIDEDPIFKPKLIALEPWLSTVFATAKGVSVDALKNLVEDRWTSYKLRYAVKNLGIPCCTIEFVPQRFGGQEAGSNDIRYYLYQLANIVGAGLSTTDLEKEWRILAEMKATVNTRRIAIGIANS